MLQNMISQGLGMNQAGNQNMMNALSMLFGGFQQSNALGTPQAQMATQPSPWVQLANAGLGLLGGSMGPAILSGLGGLFGSGSATGQPSALNPLVGQIGMTPGWQTPGPQFRPVLTQGC